MSDRQNKKKGQRSRTVLRIPDLEQVEECGSELTHGTELAGVIWSRRFGLAAREECTKRCAGPRLEEKVTGPRDLCLAGMRSSC